MLFVCHSHPVRIGQCEQDANTQCEQDANDANEPFARYVCLGGSTYKEILKDLLSKTHFFGISVKKPLKWACLAANRPGDHPYIPINHLTTFTEHFLS